MQNHYKGRPSKKSFSQQGGRFRGGHDSRSDSVSSINPWEALNMDDLARKYFVDSLACTDGFSAPFKNGKPINVKDLQSRYLQESKGRSHNRFSQEEKVWPHRKKGLVGTAKGSDLAVNKRNYQATVFATRYHPNDNILDAKKDLESNLKKATDVVHEVKIEKLETRYDSYASFKITCICPNTAAFMNPDIWPESVLFRWWRTPRNENAKYGNDTSNRIQPSPWRV